jgi:hypothetical protein
MNLWSLFWTEVITYQSETSNHTKPKSRQYIFWGGFKAQTIIFTQNKAFRVPLCQKSFQTITFATSFCLSSRRNNNAYIILPPLALQDFHLLLQILYTTSKQILHHDYYYLPSSSCECTVAVQSTDIQLVPHRLQMYAGWC